MSFLNHIMTTLFGWVLAPFEALPPLAALLLWSALIGVLMAVVFRFTSNQRALRAAADQVRANLLAIKLFQHDLGVTLRCQGGLLKAVARRLLHSLPPLVVMIVPLALILAQLALRLEHTPVTPDQAAVVELHLSPHSWQQYRDVALQVPAGARVETPALRDDQEHTVSWRVSSSGATPFVLSWQLGAWLLQF